MIAGPIGGGAGQVSRGGASSRQCQSRSTLPLLAPLASPGPDPPIGPGANPIKAASRLDGGTGPLRARFAAPGSAQYFPDYSDYLAGARFWTANTRALDLPASRDGGFRHPETATAETARSRCSAAALNRGPPPATLMIYIPPRPPKINPALPIIERARRQVWNARYTLRVVCGLPPSSTGPRPAGCGSK
jgi:hypothetical protein